MFGSLNIPSSGRYDRLDKRSKVINVLKEEALKAGLPVNKDDTKKDLENKLKEAGAFKRVVSSNELLSSWYGPRE